MFYKESVMQPKLSLFSILILMHIQPTPSADAKDSTPACQKLQPVNINQVLISDDFWAPRIRVNRETGLQHALGQLDEHGNLSNFAKAAGMIPGWHRGSHAYDSDVYKVIEGAAYSLMIHPDQQLENFLDKLIDNIAAAQQDDGYLSTSFILEKPEEKWQNVRREHEMYCAGHLFEAAAAYYEATGKRKLLNVAVKLADHIDSIFGPGKRYDVPGHEEIELALIKLYRSTGESRYFNLAKFFLDERGYAHGEERKPFDSSGLIRFSTPPQNREERIRRIMVRNGRMQDHRPVIEQTEAVGHAVRAGYLFSAMTDVAAATGDPDYFNAVTLLWKDVVQKKIYLTGGVGTAQYYDEGFGDPYLLPNDKAYSETCAQAANIFWNHRMNLLHGHAKYIDVLELSLYNAFLSGVSLSGDRFFYRNTLTGSERSRRQEWFDPACCPTNVVRMFPQIARFAYAVDDQGLYINLFVAGSSKLDLNNRSVKLTQETNYPWDGRVRISVDPEREESFSVNVRIPSWTQNGPLPGDLYRYAKESAAQIGIGLNGHLLSDVPLKNGYASIKRTWKKGDTIEMEFPLPVRLVLAHAKIEADRNHTALMRGPIVYCFEQIDNQDLFLSPMSELQLDEASFRPEFRENLLDGVVILRGTARIKSGRNEEGKEIELQAVPYYSWNNREPGAMAVWIRTDPQR
jgi:DUF1680 family protein